MTEASRNATDPFGQTQQRMLRVRPDFPDAYAVYSGVGNWTPLTELVTPVGIGRWSSALLARTGHPTVTSLQVAGSLGHAVLGRVTAALVTDRRAFDVSATNLLLEWTDGHVDRVGVRSTTMSVLPDDPSRARRGRSSSRIWTR